MCVHAVTHSVSDPYACPHTVPVSQAIVMAARGAKHRDAQFECRRTGRGLVNVTSFAQNPTPRAVTGQEHAHCTITQFPLATDTCMASRCATPRRLPAPHVMVVHLAALRLKSLLKLAGMQRVARPSCSACTPAPAMPTEPARPGRRPNAGRNSGPRLTLAAACLLAGICRCSAQGSQPLPAPRRGIARRRLQQPAPAAAAVTDRFALVPECARLAALVSDGAADGLLGNLTAPLPPDFAAGCQALLLAGPADLAAALRQARPRVKLMHLNPTSPIMALKQPWLAAAPGSVSALDCRGAWLEMLHLEDRPFNEATMIWQDCRLLLPDMAAPLFRRSWLLDSTISFPCNVRSCRLCGTLG